VNPQEEHIIDALKKGATPLPDDAYFAQLKSDVLGQLGPVPARVVPLYRKWWALASVAASLALIIALFLRGGETDPSARTSPDWNSVSREEMLAYIHENIDDFEAEAIAANLDSLPNWNAQLASADTLTLAVRHSAQARGTHAKASGYDQLFDDIDKEDILEYLDEEAIELDDELLIGS
jgi:hypothetical protein